jgi:hypothetical protein
MKDLPALKAFQTGQPENPPRNHEGASKIVALWLRLGREESGWINGQKRLALTASVPQASRSGFSARAF